MGVALLPGGEADQGDGDGVTRNQGVAVKQSIHVLSIMFLPLNIWAYMGDAFLKARGCISLM